MQHRWPKSLHSQIEAVFHGIRAFRCSKQDNPHGIRSLGAWRLYRTEIHKFGEYLLGNGITDLRQITMVKEKIALYLAAKLTHYALHKNSLQTYETVLASISKYEYAFNTYCQQHCCGEDRLDTADIRKTAIAQAKKQLPRSSRSYYSRSYPDPWGLIAAIPDETFRLQAKLQLEGGLRAEGAGSPANNRENALTRNNLRGIKTDPITDLPVGAVEVKEKGGKYTIHFISVATYHELVQYLDRYKQLSSPYQDYVKVLRTAALMTNQHSVGRGSHGLKHCFAGERYDTAIAYGLSHEEAMQAVSLELAHFRLRETWTYIRRR
jgi:hypothetical protein